MPVVVVEHECPHPQGGGGGCRSRQGSDGPELILEVIGDEQRGIAEFLGSPGQGNPARTVRGGRQLDTESKAAIMGHGGCPLMGDDGTGDVNGEDLTKLALRWWQ